MDLILQNAEISGVEYPARRTGFYGARILFGEVAAYMLHCSDERHAQAIEKHQENAKKFSSVE